MNIYSCGDDVAEDEDDPEQSVPPFSGPTFDLVRVLLPEPHDLEQELHVPQEPHLQGTEIEVQNYFMQLGQIILTLL